jgi:hypothetical protein
MILTLASSAHAYEWAVGGRINYGAYQVQNEGWKDLFVNEPFSFVGLTVDAELYHGLGPYLAIAGGETKGKILDEIDVVFSYSDFIIGAQYHHYVNGWFAPGARVGMILGAYNNNFNDGVFEKEVEYFGVGLDSAVELAFYPFAWAKNAGRGFGISLQCIYQYRPLDEMGDLVDASGIGYGISLHYKWDGDTNRKKKESPEFYDPETLEKVTPEPEPAKDKPSEPEAPPEESDTPESRDEKGQAEQPENTEDSDPA